MSYILYTLQEGELRRAVPDARALKTLTIEEIAEKGKPDGSTWQIIEEGKSTPKLDAKDLIETSASVKASIKGEAGKRINDAYPDYKQRNIDREAILTQDTTEVNIMNDVINGIRTKSNELETTVEGYNLSQLKAFDVTDDAHWS